MKRLIYTSLTLCLLMGSVPALAVETSTQMSATAPQAGAGICSGTILDEEGDPMIGASVLVKGTKIAAASDIDGRFALRDVKIGSTILISFVGYKTISVTWDGKPLKILMEPSSTALDDVVVVAYGTQKKSSITGSISQVDASQIDVRPVSSVASALEGTTSGVQITGAYGAPGTSPSITIRGIGSVNGTNEPLYVIDGVPYGGNITDLNPNDIESMSVLKDAASTALYGNRASNGVILITTKKGKNNDKVSLNLKISQGWYQRAIPEYDRVGISDFMNVSLANLANNYMATNSLDYASSSDWAAAIANAKENIISGYLYLNPFNASDDALYDANGKFNSGLAMKGSYADDLDWWDQATRSGYRSEYQVSGMGATSKSDYYFSVSYLDENGYMKNSGFERFTGRANINMNPVKWLKTGLNLSGSHQKMQNSYGSDPDDNTKYANPFMFIRNIAPIYTVHQHDVDNGNYMYGTDGNPLYSIGWYDITQADGNTLTINTRNQYVNRNVIWESQVNTANSIRNTLNGISYADIILPYGITARVQGNLNVRNLEELDYTSSVVGDAVGSGGDAKYVYNYKNYTFQQQLLWNYTFNDVHHINLLLAHENYSNMYDYTYIKKSDLAIEGNNALSNFATTNNVNGYRMRYRTESYLGRAQYNFNDRYNIEGSFRRDASSRFAKDVRWGNFGSVGANWVFSNEEFLKSQDWLNNGKLFVNWGQVGNDASAGYYSYYGLFSSGGRTQAGLPAYYLTQLAATDLKWETSEAWGVGVEGWLFNRWHVSLEYYDKTNKDQIFNLNAPASAGSTDTSSTGAKTTVNIGNISNRGFEINTDLKVWNNKDWQINIGANLSTLQNRVTKLPEEYRKLLGDEPRYNQSGQLLYSNGSPYNGYLSGSNLISEGKSRYEWFMYHWEGVDQMTGQSVYTPNLTNYYIVKEDGSYLGGIYDANGKLDTSLCSEMPENAYVMINGKPYVNSTTYAQRDYRGGALPKVFGSFNANVQWKGLTVSAMFTYSLGGKIYDSIWGGLMSVGGTPNAVASDVLNSWSGIPAGMTETSANRISRSIYPMISSDMSTTNYAGSDMMLVSRNYLCFKNLHIGYKLPKSILKNIDVQELQLSFSAENLFINSARKGMNPMMQMSGYQYNLMPPARVYTLGLSVNL